MKPGFKSRGGGGRGRGGGPRHKESAYKSATSPMGRGKKKSRRFFPGSRHCPTTVSLSLHPPRYTAVCLRHVISVASLISICARFTTHRTRTIYKSAPFLLFHPASESERERETGEVHTNVRTRMRCVIRADLHRRPKA